jgi:hypothetical protein
MRYWTFDVCALIADFEKNKRTLESVNAAMKVAKGYYENPVGATSRGDWEQYIRVLSLRQEEYQMYCDMVYLGLGDLPEVERLVLKWWLIDGYDDDQIRTGAGIKNNVELQKIKKIALTKFTNIVMPD